MPRLRRSAALASNAPLPLCACAGGTGEDAAGGVAAATTVAADAVVRVAPAPPARQGPAFEAVSVGEYHTCALTADLRAYCWGNNEFGQLGDGAHVRGELGNGMRRSVDRPTPVTVADPTAG